MNIPSPPSSRRTASRPQLSMSNALHAAAAERVVRQTSDASHELHCLLNAFNRGRLAPSAPDADWEMQAAETWRMTLLEGRFLERERRRVAPLAARAPKDPAGFVAWFEELKASGPGQGDPLFPFLAERATYEQVRWFVKQEVAGEAGFDDLVALTQIKIPERAKLEMARNYWDEMGRGKSHGMHGPMLASLAHALLIGATPERELVWEALALANIMAGLALNRRYAFHSIGALGAIELTAPTRAGLVADALDRVGVPKKATHYFRLHSTVDIGHSAAWNAEVLAPLVEANPEVATHIAEGALMRLNAGARTFDRYRAELGVTAPRGQID